jgi:hypothetical protein
VYIADPSQTVNGGTLTPPAAASLVVLPPTLGWWRRSVGDIQRFLYPGIRLMTPTNISVYQRRQAMSVASQPPGDLIDAKP